MAVTIISISIAVDLSLWSSS